jgi:hypothetical protein
MADWVHRPKAATKVGPYGETNPMGASGSTYQWIKDLTSVP